MDLWQSLGGENERDAVTNLLAELSNDKKFNFSKFKSEPAETPVPKVFEAVENDRTTGINLTNDQLQKEGLEDPILMAHMEDMRKYKNLVEHMKETDVVKKIAESKERFSKIIVDIDLLYEDVNKIFDYIHVAKKRPDALDTVLDGEEELIKLVKRLKSNIIVARRDQDSIIYNGFN